jgi:hypothetical protein
MSDFFRSRAARELAGIVRERQGTQSDNLADAHADNASDDIEYYTLRCCKQIELAGRAESQLARETHLKLADLHGARAREAMAAAMRTNGRSADVRAAALMRIDHFSLDELIGAEKADKFWSLRFD